MASKILKFIKNNPNTWEKEFNTKQIHINRKNNLVCFNYDTEADFSDPLVCEARGIIIDIEEFKVVCWPFNKFFNVQEQNAAEIDWNSARVLEKIDGSMIKLFWYKDSWRFATRSTCDASDAPVPGYRDLNFLGIISHAENINEIPFNELNKDYTYVFELVAPLSQVVIRYETAELFFLTARDNMTGEEVDVELSKFKRPKSFTLNTLDDCLKAAVELNKGDEIKAEGFVVVDAKHNRVKIKSPAYVAMHRISTNKVFTAKRMAEFFCQGQDFSKLAKDFPSNAHIIKYYDWQFAEMKRKTEDIMRYSRRLYEEYDHDRKAVAMTIKDSPYAWAGFKAIGNCKDIEEIMAILEPSKIEKLIVEYPKDYYI